MKNKNNIPTKENILNDISIINKKAGFINKLIYSKNGNYSLYYINKLFGNFTNAINEFNKQNVKIQDIPKENQINKDELFKLAINLFEQNNDLNEILFYNNMNISINKFDSLFGSFTNFLKEANLYNKIIDIRSNKIRNSRIIYNRNNSNKIFEFTKEEAINNGILMFNETGEIKKDTYLKYTNYDKQTFLNLFNTFTEFLQEAKLYEQMKVINNKKRGTKNNNFYNGNNKIKEFTKDDCFIKAKEILLSEKDLNKKLFLEKTNFDRNIFLKLFNNSFRQFIQEAGLYNEIKNARKKNDSKTIKISKEELINKILNYANENGLKKVTSANVYNELNITRNMISSYWKSFSDMKNELQINIPKEVFPSKQEIIEHMWQLYNKSGKLTSTIQRNDGKYEKRIIDNVFGSFTNMLKEMGLKTNEKNISSEDLLLDLQGIVKKYGTINSILIDKEGKYSRQTYSNRFGNINDICKKLNITNLNMTHSSISDVGRYCIYLFSEILDSNYEFEKTFNWLINPKTNYKMRLDGYFEDLKLGIEYDGIQHYEYTPGLDKTYDDFLNRQKRDKIKDQLCKENGVKLIRIKYDEPLNEEYLKQKLINEGIIKE